MKQIDNCRYSLLEECPLFNPCTITWLYQMETLSPIQALRTGLVLVLDMCRLQGLSSVALPVIGPGIALKFPLHEAIRIVTEEIIKFGWSGSTGLISTIRIVIKPGYPDSDEVSC